MMHHTLLRCVAVLALLLSAGGCGVFEAQECTLIGCEGGLMVILGEPTEGPVHIRATLPDGTVLDEECAGVLQCERGIFFANVTAPSAVLEVEMNGETRTIPVELTYVETRPNGLECGPPCPIATVDLT